MTRVTKAKSRVKTVIVSQLHRVTNPELSINPVAFYMDMNRFAWAVLKGIEVEAEAALPKDDRPRR